MAGYSHVKFNDDNQPIEVKDQMLTQTAKMESVSEKIIAINMLTTKGQEGGGLTNATTGELYGIYTGIDSFDGERYGVCARINEAVASHVLSM